MQIDDIRIVKREKVTDEKYLITVSAKYTVKNPYGSLSGSSVLKTETKTEVIPVVRVNGQWKVAQKVPGFEAVPGVAGLCIVLLFPKEELW